MITRNRKVLVLLALLALPAGILLWSCGGGGSSSTPATGVTRGAITAFGSIWVNGMEIDTDNATVRLHPDDNNADIDSPDNVAFRPGMVVTVRYRTSDNMATSVSFANELTGPVGAVDTLAGTFTVLGVTVHVDNTYFDGFGDGATIASVVAGNVVEVSGLPDAAGVLQATYVDKQADAGQAGDVYEVKGYVSSLDNAGKTFTLSLGPGGTGGVAVSYGSAAEVAAGLADNAYVEVKVNAADAATSPLAAAAVELRNELSDDAAGASKVSVSGFVSGLSGTAPDLSFFVGGQKVQTSAATAFTVTVADGAKVDVEGPVDAAGVLQAVKVEPET